MNDFLKHPFVILISTSILGVTLVPWVSEMAAQRTAVEQARVSKAIEVARHVSKIDQDLRDIQTLLETFHKDSKDFPNLVDIQEGKKELRIRTNDLYQKFSYDVWWWMGNLES